MDIKLPGAVYSLLHKINGTLITRSILTIERYSKLVKGRFFITIYPSIKYPVRASAQGTFYQMACFCLKYSVNPRVVFPSTMQLCFFLGQNFTFWIFFRHYLVTFSDVFVCTFLRFFMGHFGCCF